MALCREAAMSAVNRVLLDLHGQAARDAPTDPKPGPETGPGPEPEPGPVQTEAPPLEVKTEEPPPVVEAEGDPEPMGEDPPMVEDSPMVDQSETEPTDQSECPEAESKQLDVVIPAPEPIEVIKVSRIATQLAGGD